VLAAETEAPLVRALIQISLPERTTNVTTDAQGHYELTNIPAGRYTLSAARHGYLGRSYGQRRMLEPGQSVALNSGETLENIDFRLPKASVIAVRVTDQTGEPVDGVSVGLLQPRFNAGVRSLTQVASSILQGATDDRGEVRLSGLAAGEYYIIARTFLPVSGRRDDGRAHAPTYYPGTLSAIEAVPVFVASAQEQVVTFPLVAARAATVSGVVRRSNGLPLRRTSVSLVQTVGPVMTGHGAVVQANGTFSIENVFPGEYPLIVTDQDVDQPESNEFATMRLTVTGEDTSGLVVTTARGGAARGRVTFDAGISDDIRPGAIRLSAALSSAAARSPGAIFLARPAEATWHDDWTFSIEGLNAQRLLRLGTPGWFLKAVMLDGKDVIDTPLDFDGSREIEGLEVILTRNRSGVTGDVRDGRGRMARDFAAVLFPDDERQWTSDSRFIASGRADSQGRFKIDGMPNGEYLVAAVEFLEGGEERDPELLRQLRSRAMRLTLGEGETRTISLPLQDR
jgi:hypothetical protein